MALGVCLSLGIAGYATYSKMALEKKFEEKTIDAKATQVKLIAMTNTLGEMQSKNADSLKEISLLQAEASGSKSDVAAFAKQATSCDKVKKQLRI